MFLKFEGGDQSALAQGGDVVFAGVAIFLMSPCNRSRFKTRLICPPFFGSSDFLMGERAEGRGEKSF